jgi:hypothetical protein
MMTVAQAIEAVLKCAAYECDVRHVVEVGGNDLGPAIEAYQKSVAIPPGSPWCAAFVHAMLKQAGVPVEPATGDTWAIRDWARSKGIMYDSPSRGDIFLLLDTQGNPKHTGFAGSGPGGDGIFDPVTRAAVDAQHFRTIEGNTYGPSNEPPKGVFRKVREIYTCEYVRWANLVVPS